MNYAIAIIYYNPNEDVINRLKLYSRLFVKVLILDNSEAVEWDVKREVSRYINVEYVDMHGNKGMSIALSYAFEWANKNKIDYLLTMDQDSEYSEDNIKIMLRYIDQNHEDDVGIYAAHFDKLYYDKKTQKMVTATSSSGEIKEVCMCITSGSFINVKAIQNILPLKNYFISHVDNSISANLRCRGFRLINVGISKFQQQVGGIVNYNKYNVFVKALHHTTDRYYYTIRNVFHYDDEFRYEKLIPRKCIKSIARMGFNILVAEPHKIKKIKACYLGYRDYKRGVLGKIPDETKQFM